MAICLSLAEAKEHATGRGEDSGQTRIADTDC